MEVYEASHSEHPYRVLPRSNLTEELQGTERSLFTKFFPILIARLHFNNLRFYSTALADSSRDLELVAAPDSRVWPMDGN
jgi:hypothetical protein